MPKAHLTAESVKALKPGRGGARAVYFDAGCPGLVLRVSATARAYWFRYQRAGGRRWLRLGDAGKLKLADAHTLARTQHSLLDRGLDPIEERERLERERRHAVAEARQQELHTLAAAVGQYLVVKRDRLSPATLHEHERMLATYIAEMPSATRPVSEVKRYEVADDLRKIGGVQANRVRSLLGAASRWAAGEERLPVDVVAGVDRVTIEARRDRVLDDDELRGLWLALDKLTTAAGRADKMAAAYLRLLVLCGTRRSETAFAEWPEFDLGEKDGLWRIPAQHRKGRAMKGAAGERHGLDVPLSDLAVEVLHTVELKNTGRVFNAAIAAAPGRLMTRVRKAAGIAKDSPADFTLHDLRRSAATGWQRLGVRLEVISRLLGHTTPDLPGVANVTSSTYAKAELWEERRAAATAWGAHIRNLLAQEKPAGKVRAFNRTPVR
jgi:integrase